MHKHTQGPWIAKLSSYAPKHWYIEEMQYNGFQVASTSSAEVSHEEDEANARLIAAAPELLDAAKLALEFIKAVHGHLDGDVAQSINAAITKAEGDPK